MKMCRSYCGVLQYPGLKKFYLGTVVVDQHATDAEVRQELEKLWDSIDPHQMPPCLAVVSGSLFFAPDANED